MNAAHRDTTRRRRAGQRGLTPALACTAALILAGCGKKEGGGPDPANIEVGAKGSAAERPKREIDQDAELAQELEQLRNIGYAGGSIEDEREGVTVHEAKAVQPGLNLYSSGHALSAYLMDARGKVLHEWHSEIEEVWADYPRDSRRRYSRSIWWRRVHLLPDGALLAIVEGVGIMKLDAQSEVMWAVANGAHHDLSVTAEGEIWVLTREPRVVSRVHPRRPVLEDFLTILDAGGNQKRNISLLESILRSDESLLKSSKRQAGDMMHTNTVHILDGSIADRLPAFERGNVLLSMNAMGLIAVLDVERETLVWVHQRPPQGQHDPHILDNGNLLFFDNREEAGDSVVREVDPTDWRQIWQYAGSPQEPFYSRFCGSAQRLANGNTLITESDAGRAFEVDEEGRIVWEFFNPHRTGTSKDLIAAIAEMERLPPDLDLDWLE